MKDPCNECGNTVLSETKVCIECRKSFCRYKCGHAKTCMSCLTSGDDGNTDYDYGNFLGHLE